MSKLIQEHKDYFKSIQFKPILLSIANESEPKLWFLNRKEIVLNFESADVIHVMTIQNTSEATNTTF